MNFNLSGYTIALIAGGFGIIGALLGNWASHRFSDHRDRRKEFNEAADALARILTKEKVRPIPSAHIDFFSFQRVIEGRKLRNFNRAIELYEKAKKEQETNLCHDYDRSRCENFRVVS